MELRQGQPAGESLGKEGDQLSHQLLMERLGQMFPSDRIRSEEALLAEHLDDPGVGCGSSIRSTALANFPEGREDWAVHVALAIDGEPVVGAVALPALGMVLGTENPPALSPVATVPRIVISRSRPPDFIPAVAERLGARTITMGSAGAKIAAVIRGEAEIYLHAGGQYEWDSAAPVAVALASGLHARRLDGSPLRYSQPDPYLPDLVVCHPSLAEAVTDALVAAGVSGP